MLKKTVCMIFVFALAFTSVSVAVSAAVSLPVLTLEITSYEAPYDSAPHTVTVLVLDDEGNDVTESADILYSRNNEDWSEDPPTWVDYTFGPWDVYVKADYEGYATTTSSGTVNITKADLTVTVFDQTHNYTGYPVGEADPIYADPDEIRTKVDVIGLQGDDYIYWIMLDGSETNVGEYANCIQCPTIVIRNSDDTKVNDNYEITKVAGKLTVETSYVTVTVADASKDPGDEDPEFPKAVLSGDSIEYLDGLDLSVIRTNTDVEEPGFYEGVLTTDKTAAEFQEGRPGFIFTIINGDFTINPIAVTLTAVSEEKEYNGAEQELSGYTCDVEGLEFEGVSASVTGKDVGGYTLEFSGAEVGVTTDTTGKYIVGDLVSGVLNIVPAELTIEVNEQEYDYNGSSQGETGGEDSEYTSAADISEKVTVTGLCGEDAITKLVLDGSETNAGTYEGCIDVVEGELEIGESTGNYNISYVSGTLIINKLTLTVVANDAADEEYDGLEHTGETVYAITGLLEDHTATVDYEPACGTDAGTYTGSFDDDTLVVMCGDDEVTANYVLGDMTPGSITVTARKLDLTVEDKTVDFNSAEQYGESGITVTGLVEGDECVIEEGAYTPSYGTAPDVYDNGEFLPKFVFTVTNADGDVTGNYVIGETTAGKLTILECNYTVSFLDDNGGKLLSAEYGNGTPGSEIVKPETPAKADDEQYTYTFAGWSDGVSVYAPDDVLPDVTGEATYTAVFDAEEIPAPPEPGGTPQTGDSGRVLLWTAVSVLIAAMAAACYEIALKRRSAE
ncbi:MAG: hypothetical protein IJK33_05930 [Clostridia bacterium]|nr:hypothetical protein [Clostridia bacterium]